MNEDHADRLRIDSALKAARDTKQLLIGRGVLRDIGALFASLFPNQPAILVADDSTYTAAGKSVEESLGHAGVSLRDAVVLPSKGLYAESRFVDQALAAIANTDAIPIAVGAGTINDVVKLAAHRAGRRYLCVATAASMDGYTAYGSSISHKGSKQTFDCPAPLGVVADIDIIAAAPPWLNASGYADLFAKCPAGADWLLADGMDVDPIDAPTWGMVQDRLRDWLADPNGVRRGEIEPIHRLTLALMMTGFAMQASLSSRPASGAEHQFSHLWDMENHTHEGESPSHGFKVGIGSLASLRLYEAIQSRSLDELDIDSAVAQWPEWEQEEGTINGLFDDRALVGKALEESHAKRVLRDELHTELEKLANVWPQLRDRLKQQVYPVAEARDMLAAAGCPIESYQIGISAERLRSSHLKAYYLRRRYTVLDFVRRAGLWQELIGDGYVSANPEALL
jgi:glycerol-1-phosphate dehydrogenase [NAD(P)+]